MNATRILIISLFSLTMGAVVFGQSSPAIPAPEEEDSWLDAVPVPVEDSPAASQDQEEELIILPPATTTEPTTRRNEVVSVMSSTRINENERALDVVTILGNSSIFGRVDGDVVTVVGSTYINGRVSGDVVNVMGNLEMGPLARVDGDVVVVGGRLTRDPAAIIRGEIVEVSFLPANIPPLRWVSRWFQEGISKGRWIVPGLIESVIFSLFLLALHLLIALAARDAVTRNSDLLRQKPTQAFLAGLLILILAGPLFFTLFIVLAITVVGLLALPFIKLAFLFAVFYGFGVVYARIGQLLGIRNSIVAATALGGGLAFLLYAVPVLGILFWLSCGLLGSGTVALALIQSSQQRTQPQRRTAASYAGPQAQISQYGESAAPVPGPIPPTSGFTTPELDPDRASGTTAAAPAAANESAVPPTGLTPPVQPASTQTSAASHPSPLLSEADRFERVGFLPRLGAVAIDGFAVLGLALLLGLQDRFVILFLAYHLIFHGLRATTLGGSLLKMKIVRLDGQPLHFGAVVVRSFCAIFSLLLLGLGFLWVAWDPQRQSWHDKLAGTTIIRLPHQTPLV